MTRLNIPLFVALAASLLSAVPVDARETLPHQRMIRKRGPAVVDGPGPVGAAAVIGLHVRQVIADPTGSASQVVSSTPASTTTAAASTTREAASTTAAAPTTTSVATTSTVVPTTTSTSLATSVTPTTTSGGLLATLTGILGSSSSTSSTTTTTTTPSSSSSISTTPVSSSTPASTSTTQVVAPTTTQAQQPDAETSPTLNIATPPPTGAARSPSISINVITSTKSITPEASASQVAKEKVQKITRNTIVSLVVIASCIGGAVAIWTVIRKWKLSPSEKFDDRMQPIDWAPPPANGAAHDAIDEKTKHRRAGSGASHGSFTSGGVGQSEQGHGAKYAESQHSHAYPPQDLPPAHDFTAGTQTGGYGQYYGGHQYAGAPGYADLQRGPSLSESNYSRGADVSRGMSYSRGHGAYDSQSGAVPPMPNPYGGEHGYEDFNHPQATQQPQAQAQGQAPYRPF